MGRFDDIVNERAQLNKEAAIRQEEEAQKKKRIEDKFSKAILEGFIKNDLPNLLKEYVSAAQRANSAYIEYEAPSGFPGMTDKRHTAYLIGGFDYGEGDERIYYATNSLDLTDPFGIARPWITIESYYSYGVGKIFHYGPYSRMLYLSDFIRGEVKDFPPECLDSITEQEIRNILIDKWTEYLRGLL